MANSGPNAVYRRFPAFIGNWVRDGVVPLAAALAYAVWAHPLFALLLQDPLTGAKNPGFTFWLCLGILLGGLAAARLEQRWARSAHGRLAIVGEAFVVLGGLAAIVLSLFLVAPAGGQGVIAFFARWQVPDLSGASIGAAGHDTQIVPVSAIMLICVVLLWSQGVRLASADPSFIRQGFGVGVVALAGELLLALTMASRAAQNGSGASAMLHTISSGMAPMAFLISLPLVLLLIVFSRLLGEGAIAVSQVVLIVGLLLLATVLPSGLAPGDMVSSLLIFITCGLLAMSLRAVTFALQEQERITGARSQVSGYWVTIMIGTVAAVLLLGMLVSQLAAPQAVAYVIGWLKPLGAVVLRAFLFIVFALAYLFFGLLEALPFGFLDRLSEVYTRLLQMLAQLLSLAMGEGEAERSAVHVSPLLGKAITTLLILGLVALVSWLILLAIRRFHGPSLDSEGIRETRWSILSWKLLREQILGLFRRRRKAKALPPFLALDRPNDPRQIVRGLYQKMLSRAGTRGAARRRGQTPYAYLRTLSSLWPAEYESLEMLTAIYQIARYGALPPSDDQVQATREAFIRIVGSEETRA